MCLSYVFITVSASYRNVDESVVLVRPGRCSFSVLLASVDNKGRFCLVLYMHHVPKPMYQYLILNNVPWRLENFSMVMPCSHPNTRESPRIT